MKILLVYPCFLDPRQDETDISAVPMGLYYLGAMLIAHGHQVQLLNLYDPGTPPEAIRPYLEKLQPEVVGFSIVHANRWGGIDMAATIKQAAPGIITVFGGIGATFLWHHLLTHFPQIDYVVVGEGERTMTTLAELLPDPPPEALAGVRGLAFRRGEEIIQTGPPEPIDNLDDLPNPAEYFTYPHLALTRGCPENCAFCGSPDFWNRRVRFHSADYFVRQLRLLYEKGVHFFYVSDDTLTLKKDRIIAICRAVIDQELPITWAAISRVDMVDPEILYWMRRAGCTQISYGVEHGDPEIRKTLGKRISDEAVERAFRLTTRYGILPRAYFIYGCPGETEETIARTEALIRRVRPLSVIFYILAVFPGTGLYEEMKRRFGVTDDIWKQRIEDILWFEYDPEISKDAVLAWGKRLREGFHRSLPDFVREIEVIDDPEFASPHADFFSRLGMTFLRGDYAQVAEIPDRAGLAEGLFRRALDHAPDERAFLGLGMLRQDARDMEGAVRRFEEGIGKFPRSLHLNLGLGVSLMNLERFEEALAVLRPFAGDRTVAGYVGECERVLGRRG
ncbi:MAG: radical SAM protein [Desulfococcaceae bacterium]